jgi:hypothetical protein
MSRRRIDRLPRLSLSLAPFALPPPLSSSSRHAADAPTPTHARAHKSPFPSTALTPPPSARSASTPTPVNALLAAVPRVFSRLGREQRPALSLPHHQKKGPTTQGFLNRAAHPCTISLPALQQRTRTHARMPSLSPNKRLKNRAR